LYPLLIAERRGAIVVYESGAEFLDVGTARDYVSTVATVGAREGHPFDVGTDCRIAPDARIERTVLWDRVVIGAGAHLVNSVVADDVVVPAGAQYDHCVLVRGTSGLQVSPL
jgi:NDP-sugar pyrophosphorylase family protein